MKTHRLITLFLLLTLVFAKSYAQSDGKPSIDTLSLSQSVQVAKNSFFMDFGGNSNVAISYDRLFPFKDGNKASVRIGIGGNERSTGFWVPLDLNLLVLVGKGNNHFEIGLGTSIGFGDLSGLPTALPPGLRVGYRYQEFDGGFFLRAGVYVGISPIYFGMGFTPKHSPTWERQRIKRKIIRKQTPMVPIDEIYRNTIFVEVGGNNLYYSISYDRLFPLGNGHKISAQLGIGLLTESHFWLPFGVNYLYGRFNSHLELGLGSTIYTIDSESESFEGLLAPGLRIGYRYQKADGGMFFRAGFHSTPRGVPFYLGVGRVF